MRELCVHANSQRVDHSSTRWAKEGENASKVLL